MKTDLIKKKNRKLILMYTFDSWRVGVTWRRIIRKEKVRSHLHQTDLSLTEDKIIETLRETTTATIRWWC